MAIAREEAGTAKMPDASTGALSGDYVVPQYDENGRRLTSGAIVGGLNTQSVITKKISRMFEAKGDRIGTPKIVLKQPAITPPLVGPKPKTAKAKAAKKVAAVVQPEEVPVQFEPEPLHQFEPEPTPFTPAPKSIVVVLGSKLGKIKVAVNAVLESETGLCLVFEDEDRISYEPEQGSELTITMPDKRNVNVMAMGLRFKWYGSKQQLMTFIKTEKEE